MHVTSFSELSILKIVTGGRAIKTRNANSPDTARSGQVLLLLLLLVAPAATPAAALALAFAL